MKRLLLSIAVALAFAVPMHAADSTEVVVSSLVKQAPGLREDVLKLALTAARRAEDQGLVPRRDLLTVIDYSLPSSQPRLFCFDLAAHKLLFRELVAHGKGSGGDVANFFSNSPGSLATSIGLFVTADTYEGGNGYSLRLRGLDLARSGCEPMSLHTAQVDDVYPAACEVTKRPDSAVAGSSAKRRSPRRGAKAARVIPKRRAARS